MDRNAFELISPLLSYMLYIPTQTEKDDRLIKEK